MELGERIHGRSKPAAVQKALQDVELTAEGGMNFYTTDKGRRRRSFSVTPAGSLIATRADIAPLEVEL